MRASTCCALPGVGFFTCLHVSRWTLPRYDLVRQIRPTTPVETSPLTKDYSDIYRNSAIEKVFQLTPLSAHRR